MTVTTADIADLSDAEYVYAEYVKDALESYPTEGPEALAYLADICGWRELAARLRNIS